MNKWTLIICGIVAVGFVPISPNEFAKGFWGLDSTPRPASSNSGTATTLNQDARLVAASALMAKGQMKQGVFLIKQLASEGHAASQTKLGDLYVWGNGIARNPQEAVRLWRLAARRGNKEAVLRVAAAYDQGIGVGRNLGVAFLWGKVAAIAGDPEAQFNVASRYIFGIGTAPDLAEGERWLTTAANNGNERARKALAEKERQAALSPAQRAAERILASGEPLTIQELTNLSRIINGEQAPDLASPVYGALPDYAAQPDYGARSAYSAADAANILPQIGAPIGTGDVPSRARALLDEQHEAPAISEQSAAPLARNNRSASPATAPNNGAVDVRTGRYYAPAGAGYVNTQNGTYYAPAGPNGVIDTRTGAFIPISR
ncbi:tetratricopeptide repeat protein [Sphingobium sp. TKS]|uniref:tetratricopeptide repeat protein n=1 Tax=Sphingobium sp. TKS TaxID=1315974 RepID=UPI00076FF31F|nr:tetratricopeptide repeat protein [Sphingobium sp. TKS]AMK24907.1 Sel1 domain-containing protein repeat-containing protein [Sphingobium sp. TKS]